MPKRKLNTRVKSTRSQPSFKRSVSVIKQVCLSNR